MCREVAQASLREGQVRAGSFACATVARWQCPPRGWLKVNVDGARTTASGLAFCGGLGRDEDGQWRFGFSKKIGVCSAFEAEV
ncbi:hypothetical protein like AT5G42905 [Hibiscus trionum]|uniref:RNase H type-1 domain-containing protein n=1 Tax=Hibiscus trionum TaxID=183268 RepID=A0A9W7MRL7_HIBTR|nr:hypothetical protein like AT5G42905 [Hibiscus trionum]